METNLRSIAYIAMTPTFAARVMAIPVSRITSTQNQGYVPQSALFRMDGKTQLISAEWLLDRWSNGADYGDYRMDIHWRCIGDIAPAGPRYTITSDAGIETEYSSAYDLLAAMDRIAPLENWTWHDRVNNKNRGE